MDGTDRVIVMGTEGIGKTSFALYAVWYALQLNKTVVYRHLLSPHEHIIFTPGTSRARRCYRPDGPPELDDPANVYVVDGIQPLGCEAFSLLVSYPKREVVKEWLKGDACQYFFPVWTAKEMSLLVKHCESSSLSDVEIRARMGVVGGIPRQILHQYKWDNRIHHLEHGISRAIEQYKTKQLSRWSYYFASNEIFSLDVDRSTFEVKGLVFASDVTRKMVFKELTEKQQLEVIKLMEKGTLGYAEKNASTPSTL